MLLNCQLRLSRYRLRKKRREALIRLQTGTNGKFGALVPTTNESADALLMDSKGRELTLEEYESLFKDVPDEEYEEAAEEVNFLHVDDEIIQKIIRFQKLWQPPKVYARGFGIQMERYRRSFKRELDKDAKKTGQKR